MTPETIDAMLAAGASAEVIAAAWKGELADQERAAHERRAKDRDRQARHRSSRDVTPCHSDNPAPLNPPLKVSPDPFKKSPPISPRPVGRGSRLPSNFEAPGEWIDWAAEKRGWSRRDAIDEAECFVRYWQAKPGKDAVKLDWLKTWQNWVSNSRRASNADPPAWDVMP